MAYQDVYLRGVTTPSGDRRCAQRYAIVRSVVKAFTRQVTVWDIGANLGYFGCRLADEFGAVSVMVEQRRGILDVCQQNALPTTIALQRSISVTELSELAACEHADVVLAMNVLHHMPDWRDALTALLEMGESIIIETPGRGDRGSAQYARAQEILDTLETLAPEQIGESPSHVTSGVRRPMFLLQRPRTSIRAGYAYPSRVRAKGPQQVRPHVITATPHEKSIQFEDGPARPWIAGMNLWNWLQMGGGYPDRETVQATAAAALGEAAGQHGDLRPWNVILSGQQAHVIDGGHRHGHDAATLAESLTWLAKPELAYV